MREHQKVMEKQTVGAKEKKSAAQSLGISKGS